MLSQNEILGQLVNSQKYRLILSVNISRDSLVHGADKAYSQIV